MEFFEKAVAVKLQSNRDKYLVAEEDQQTVRQSRSAATTRRARWLVEFVESNPHVIRLKSCYGRYLTASNTPFLLGMTGNKVLQTLPEHTKELSIEWQPIRDGFQVKLKAFDGSVLRANGATPPWRNTVTHDSSFSSSTHNWILWDVEVVDIPEDESFNDYLSMISNLSSVSDELSVLEFGSPMSVHSSFSPRTPRLSMNKRLPIPQTAMDLFKHAREVRLKSHHDKYLHAHEDEESVSQGSHASAKNCRWTVEFVDNNSDGTNIIRLKSCFNKYLTASNQPFLLGMTGRKVLQTLPRRLDSSVEWEPIKYGTNQVKLKTRYGQFLRANGGVPPWRNSVTHDIPHRTATQDWIIWDVDIVDIVVESPVPRPPPQLVPHSYTFTGSESSPTKSHSFSRQEWSDWHVNSPPKREDGRAIYYHIIAEGFGEMDEDDQGFCINFKGNGVDELTRSLEQETGLQNISVCSRSPVDDKLYPLQLQLPPNSVTMKVVVVQSSSEEGKYL